MALRLTLTDGSGVSGLQAVFGAFINTSVVATAADAAAAAASALQASSSASAASASASAASGSASASAASATAASGSASAASGSASAAAGSATSASTSATNSANSATAAAGSATAAGNSATAAAGSASAAATSASNAAATLANALTKANNLSDVANVSTSRSNLGLGTAATVNTGTSGAVVPLLNGTNTWAAQQTMSVRPVFNGNTPWDSGNLSSFLSGHNRIINGDCRIAQRGSLVASAGLTGYGGPDRFLTSNSGSAGGQFTQSQGTIIYGGVTRPAVVQTCNVAIASLAGSNFWLGITQLVEGYNCADMLGAPAAISFIFNTNVTGTYSVALRDGNDSNSFLSTFSATANTPIKVSIPVSTLPTSLVTGYVNTSGLSVTIGALNQGTYTTATVNSWTTGNFITTSAATTNWATASGNFIALTELQLEAGSVATAFARRSCGQEITLCQRYYETGAQPQSYLGGSLTGISTAYGDCQFQVPKRAAPTITQSGWQYFNGPTATAMTANFNQIFSAKFGFTVTGATNWNGWAGAGAWTASAEL